METIIKHWDIITAIVITALPLAEIIVRLTPTQKDDTALDWIKKLFNSIVPNRKKGGGIHE